MIAGFDERSPKLAKTAPLASPAIDESDSFADMGILSEDLCLCGDEESAKACAANGICKCFEFTEIYADTDMDKFLMGQMGEELKPKTAEQDKEKLPKFMLSVPRKFVPSETAPPPAPKAQASRSCHRYTFTEEKALVHAKLRLQIEGFVGMENGLKLTDYYEYYLQKLAPSDYRRYHRRDASALTRKFKAIKHNSPKLVPYIDRNVESRFWDELVQLVAHKPLLHPIFYKEKPNGRSQE